ncbi:unnamed protein product [Mytilus coruscus]|uniref:Retrotransposon gag domain-containing protein n=1 Tax=Mytilus coruscus TaxID=42192 RepID=A0A6J8D8W7_MYTCO|nr:unnamed protein product [Mytilus coruscus]
MSKGGNRTGAKPSNYPNTRANQEVNTNSLPETEDQLEVIEEEIELAPVPEVIQEAIQEVQETMAARQQVHLPQFSDEKTQVPNIWWSLFESWQKCTECQEQKSIDNLPFFLTGQAGLWFHKLTPDTRASLDNIKAAFIQRFTDHTITTKLYTIKQNVYESGNDYIARIRQSAFSATDMPEHAMIGLAVNRLRQNLKPFVLGKSPKTFEELRKAELHQ